MDRDLLVFNQVVVGKILRKKQTLHREDIEVNQLVYLRYIVAKI